MVTTLGKGIRYIRYYAEYTGIESDESTDMIGARQDSYHQQIRGEDMTLSSSDIVC